MKIILILIKIFLIISVIKTIKKQNNQSKNIHNSMRRWKNKFWIYSEKIRKINYNNYRDSL